MNIIAQDFDRDILEMTETIDLAPDIPGVVAATRDLLPTLNNQRGFGAARRGDHAGRPLSRPPA